MHRSRQGKVTQSASPTPFDVVISNVLRSRVTGKWTRTRKMKNATIFVCGFILGVAALLVVPRILASQFTPHAPQLKEAEKIIIFLHPWGGYEAATNKAITIPPESQNDVYRRLVPDRFYGKVYEHITPLVAEAVIIHKDGKQSRVLVREGGVNPALVSVDGVNYFYAKNESDVYAGANELIKMVSEIAYKQSAQIQSK